jgi:putative serine protease PepD
VEAGGGAAKAGIESGDVITSVNGADTPTMAALAEALTAVKPGEQAKVEVLRRDGSRETVTVTLGQLPGE